MLISLDQISIQIDPINKHQQILNIIIFMDRQDCIVQSLGNSSKNRSWSVLQDRKMNIFLILCYHRLYQQQNQLSFQQDNRKKPNNRLKFNFFLEMGQFVGDRTNKQCRTHYDRKIRDKKYHENLETYIMKKCFNTFKIGTDNVEDLIKKLREEVTIYLNEKKNQAQSFLLNEFQHNVRVIHDKCLESMKTMKKKETKSRTQTDEQEGNHQGKHKNKYYHGSQHDRPDEEFNSSKHTTFDVEDLMSSGCDDRLLFNNGN